MAVPVKCLYLHFDWPHDPLTMHGRGGNKSGAMHVHINSDRTGEDWVPMFGVLGDDDHSDNVT